MYYNEEILIDDETEKELQDAIKNLMEEGE